MCSTSFRSPLSCMSDLETLAFRGPVTALAFLNNNILISGAGPFLKFIDVTNGKIIRTEDVFSGSRIHEIVVAAYPIRDNDGRRTTYTIAVYGGKLCKMYKVVISMTAESIEHLSLQHLYTHNHCDWIKNVHFLYDPHLSAHTNPSSSYPNTDDRFRTDVPTHVTILTAHNVLTVFSIIQSSHSDVEARLIHFVPFMSFRSTRCILYSGGAHGSTWSNLVIASGTVFNEVHLWRLPSLASLDNFCNKSKSSGFQPHGEVIRVGNVIDVDVFKKLVGHEGVVFYVSFSKDGKLLSSTSDDRTVRLWNADHNAQCEPFHTYYGHTSRVWQSRILESLNYIVTVSEDNTCRVWSYPTLDDAEQEAKCLAVLSGHSGRNCWSVAISNDLGVVATGGADAGIRFWNLKEMKRNLIETQNELECIPQPPSTSYEPALTDGVKDRIRNYIMLPDEILASTNLGYLLLFHNTKRIWTSLFYSPLLYSYTVLGSSPCGKLVVAGAIDGCLFILNTETKKVLKLKPFVDKVYSIWILPRADNANSWNVYVHSYPDVMMWFRTDFDCQTTQQILVGLVARLILPEPKSKEVLMYLHLELSVDETILALTSRQGELLFYEIGPHVRDSAKRMETPEDFDDIFEKAKLEASVLNTENEPPVLPSSNEGSDENPEIPSVESVVSSKTKSGRRAQKKQARGQIHTITPQLLSRKFTIPSTFPDPPNQIHPVLLFTKAHGQSVTCVVIQEVLPEHDADVPEYDEQNEPSIENYASSAIKEYRIVTTGRDGVFAQWRYTRTPLKRSDISPTSSNRPSFAKTERPKLHEDIEVSVENNNNLIWLKRVTRERITKGWVERCILVDNEVLLLGFYQRRFWVWNETRKFKMVSIACGGAHRFWHFRTQDSELNNAMFTFIRREYIYAHIRSQKASSPFSSTKLQQSFHGRETRVVKFCRDDFNRHHKSPSVRSVISRLHNVLITASEDCSVRFFECIDTASFDQRLQDLTSMRKHTSVIRCLDISVGNIPLLFTAGGCEELRCWKLESHGPALTALDCAVCPIVSSVQETRIMDMSVFPYTQNDLVYHILCLANSDGYIRVFVFDEMNQKFYLLSENNLGKCLLSVKHVSVPPSTPSNSLESVENDHVVLVSTTFGHVYVFSISAVLHAFFVAYSAVPDPKPIRVKSFYFTESKMKEIIKWKPHQSGVNSMDVMRDGNKLLVVTGGDDNALSVSSIDIMDGSVKMETYYTAHASSVTAVKIIRGITKAEETAQWLYVASAAVDQRVSIWRVSSDQFASGSASTQRDTNKNSDLIQLMISKFVNVPDIGDMDVMFDGSTGQLNVVAVGLGIELLKCNIIA